MCHRTESTHAPGLVHSEGDTQEGIAAQRVSAREREGGGGSVERGGGCNFLVVAPPAYILAPAH